MSRSVLDDERTIVTRNVAPKEPPKDQEACLVIIYGGDLGRRVALTRGGAVEIGRAPSCDLSIDQESISRRHARVVWSEGRWRISDLGSTNGTLVNEQPVKEKALSDGDQIKLGRCILKFLESGSVETSYHEEIYRLMTFDGLTNIHNKRFFHETLEREVSRGRRYARELSLIVFDIDHFKKVNDTFGHIAGDSVLRQMASIVGTNLRREDIFARVGGEEFAVLLPEIPLERACTVAEKVRAFVQQSEFLFEGTRIPVTVSLGVAILQPSESAEAFFTRADAQLYRAKGAGRNRVCS